MHKALKIILFLVILFETVFPIVMTIIEGVPNINEDLTPFILLCSWILFGGLCLVFLVKSSMIFYSKKSMRKMKKIFWVLPCPLILGNIIFFGALFHVIFIKSSIGGHTDTLSLLFLCVTGGSAIGVLLEIFFLQKRIEQKKLEQKRVSELDEIGS